MTSSLFPPHIFRREKTRITLSHTTYDELLRSKPLLRSRVVVLIHLLFLLLLFFLRDEGDEE